MIEEKKLKEEELENVVGGARINNPDENTLKKLNNLLKLTKDKIIDLFDNDDENNSVDKKNHY